MPRQASAQFTRPADTTAYAAGDVKGAAAAVLRFRDLAGPQGGAVLLAGVGLRLDVASVPSGMGNMRLELYSRTPASALADNAAWDLPAGDRAAYQGSISIGTPVDKGSTLFIEATGLNKVVHLEGPDLYAYLVTEGAFTPTSAAVGQVTLSTI